MCIGGLSTFLTFTEKVSEKSSEDFQNLLTHPEALVLVNWHGISNSYPKLMKNQKCLITLSEFSSITTFNRLLLNNYVFP